MRFNETTRFMLLTLGAFFLSLGAAVLLFSLIEQLFFDLRDIGLVVPFSLINIIFGVSLLLVRWRKST